MNPKNLAKLKKQLQEMRRSPQGRKASDFVSIAKQLGMARDSRGKEPTYVRESDPSLTPPLSIPGHTGDLKVGTAVSIIDALLSSVDDWEIFLAADTENETDDD